MPAPPRPLPREQHRSARHRSGTGSGAGGGSRARGERVAWGRSVRELGDRFGSRNERTVFLTDDGLFTYYGFVTITTSSRIMRSDLERDWKGSIRKGRACRQSPHGQEPGRLT
jgi:hypothetical protein